MGQLNYKCYISLDLTKYFINNYRYDCIFNAAGETKINLCKQLCSVCGIVVTIGPHRLPSDSYSSLRRFFYNIWLKLVYVSVFY